MSQTAGRKTKYSYREYECFPNDGFRHEIINGEHYMSLAPSTKHQKVSRKIHFQLYSQIEVAKKGEVYNAPTDVEPGPHDIVQPDIVVIAFEQLYIITPKKIKGIPSLVGEILSESNPRHDQVLKFEMHQRNGIPEYWIVDPDEETVQQYVLDGGRYVHKGSQHESIVANCMVDVVINLIDAWS